MINWSLEQELGPPHWGQQIPLAPTPPDEFDEASDSRGSKTTVLSLPETDDEWRKFYKRQGVIENAHETAAAAPKEIQELVKDGGLVGSLPQYYFIGSDEKVYERSADVARPPAESARGLDASSQARVRAAAFAHAYGSDGAAARR